MSTVVTGLEVLASQGPAAAGLARGVRVGLVAHPASVDRRLRHAIEVLPGAGLDPARWFAPEHGVLGEAQDMEAVDGGSDGLAGLPVVSLYGRDSGSLRPGPEHLEDLDAVVFDLQDVGSRYYTFVYTLSYVMEACAPLRIPVVVLDRPNPLGGIAVQGPVLESSLASFVGRFPVPVRHGMTTGELAAMFRDEFGLSCDLRIVPMRGWRREQEFESTGLPWVAPSPNMPSTATARVYPGACLVEGTNLSEGRGTTRPFELMGAPWMDGGALARAAAAEDLPGVFFRATTFRPEFQKHAGKRCGGVQVHVADAARFLPFETFLLLIREARRLGRGDFDWRREPYEFERDRLAIDLLLGKPDLRGMIEDGLSVAEMRASWQPALDAFLRLRRRFLIYPE